MSAMPSWRDIVPLTADKIQAGAITADKLAAGSISTAKLWSDWCQVAPPPIAKTEGTQVWCGNEMIGWLKHEPMTGDRVRIRTTSIDLSPISDFASSTKPIAEQPVAHLIELPVQRRQFVIEDMEMIHFQNEAQLAAKLQRSNVPPSAERFEEPSGLRHVWRWRVLIADLDTSEIIFDLDEFMPVG